MPRKYYDSSIVHKRQHELPGWRMLTQCLGCNTIVGVVRHARSKIPLVPLRGRGHVAYHYSSLWLRVTVYDTNITNPNPIPDPNPIDQRMGLIVFV